VISKWPSKGGCPSGGPDCARSRGNRSLKWAVTSDFHWRHGLEWKTAISPLDWSPLNFTVHLESECFQQFRWHVSVVFVSTHPLLQLRRTSVFLRRNPESCGNSLKRTWEENDWSDCFRLRKIGEVRHAATSRESPFLILKYIPLLGRVRGRRSGSRPAEAQSNCSMPNRNELFCTVLPRQMSDPIDVLKEQLSAKPDGLPS
jgi:hypothetical protein